MKKGDVADANIFDIKPHGFECRISGESRKGLIRYWDWDWIESLNYASALKSKESYIDKTVKCRVRKIDSFYQQIILSPREIRPDEWDQAVRGLRPRLSEVEGEVIRLKEPDTYYVRLTIGIVGSLKKTDVPLFPGGMTQGLLMGDQIRAVVKSIDREKHRVVLSIGQAVLAKRRRALAKEWDREQHLIDSEHDEQQDASIRIELDPSDFDQGPLAIKSVGWVEDVAELAAPLHELISRKGVSVHELPTQPSEFLVELSNLDLDLCVIDINLGRYSNGIELASAAIEDKLLRPDQILFFTGVGELDLLEQARALDPLDVLSKGKDQKSLIYYLFGLSPVRERFSAVDEASVFDAFGDAPNRSSDYYLYDISSELSDSIKMIGEDCLADRIVLAHFEVGSGFHIREQWPDQFLSGMSLSRNRLRYTPVFDVIRTGTSYWDPRCIANPKKYNHLFAVLGSCVSIRVAPLNPFGITTDVLIMMSDEEDMLSDSKQIDSYARYLRVQIENQQLWERLELLNRAAQTGMVAVGIVHDLKGKVTPINGGIALLSDKVEDLMRSGEVPSKSDINDCLQDLEDMDRSVNQLMIPVQRLLDNVRGVEPVEYNPTEGISRAVDTVLTLEETRNARVAIEIDSEEVNFELYGSTLVLEQTLFNILLNAVQQISLSEDPCGEVCVNRRVEKIGTSEETVVITISDSGPGIHKSDFDRIFDFGFTTRPKGQGTGIGLFHTRQLARSLGAKVEVSESVLFFGTTFTVSITK